jgi:tRNA (guanine37-N1)-methyltransferase
MRLRKGILGKDESAVKESFSDGGLEYPQYTKPEILEIRDKRLGNRKYRVPKVLLTGHHKNIEEFRQSESIKRTKKRRPDLVKQ